MEQEHSKRLTGLPLAVYADLSACQRSIGVKPFMVKVAQIVMGPAGSGKSTYCHTMQQHCVTTKRTVHVVNLDPVRPCSVRLIANATSQAAETLAYEATIDVRDLISLTDVMEVNL